MQHPSTAEVLRVILKGGITINWTTWIGLGAAICTTGAFLPQVVKTFKTRRTRDISLPMYLILVVGLSLWLAYGLILRDMPLVMANGLSLILASSVLMLKLKHG